MNEHVGKFIEIEGRGRILITNAQLDVALSKIGDQIKANGEIVVCKGTEYFKANTFRCTEVGIIC